VILALESSCDETALAVFDPGKGLAGEWTRTQIELHGRHGGVVPDLATREHLRLFGPLIERAFESFDPGGIERVAVTNGPGLAACLAIGVAAAKALSLSLKRPLAGVNHLRAHAWSPFMPIHATDPAAFDGRIGELLPHLGLIVSGGNTLLFSLEADRTLTQIATTRDDAAGEALDKGAKLLGLAYPGGPLVEKLAETGQEKRFRFPRGLPRRSQADFSFSGLKTSLRYLLEKMTEEEIAGSLPDLCAGYQRAVIDALVRKTENALGRRPGHWRSLGLSGGVANNRLLRSEFASLAERQGIKVLPALPQHTGDNAGMIAFAAWADAGGVDSLSGMELRPLPSLELEN